MDTSPPNKRLKLENDNDENESTVVHKGTYVKYITYGMDYI